MSDNEVSQLWEKLDEISETLKKMEVKMAVDDEKHRQLVEKVSCIESAPANKVKKTFDWIGRFVLLTVAGGAFVTVIYFLYQIMQKLGVGVKIP